MSFILALLAQIGPFPGASVQPASPLPPEVIQRKEAEARKAQVPAAAAPAPQSSSVCPDMANPVDAVEEASAMLAQSKGTPRATAGECLGVALSTLERWDEAAEAFRDARGYADTPVWRARLGAMAGEAALNAGDAAAALASLDSAAADAKGDATMTGGLALYRARALVALDRPDDAAAALAQARANAPQSAQAWLLSATLSRRQGKLGEAQSQIERAYDLRPIDPEIGLEAGVIAVLSGRDEAARKSWQSVIAAAPDSAFAQTARGYIDQLAPPGQRIDSR